MFNPNSPVVDLLAPDGKGPLWGTETDDLNATLLAWPANRGTGEHVNSERDVIVVFLTGSAIVAIDGELHEVRDGQTLISRAQPQHHGGSDWHSVSLRASPPRTADDQPSQRRRSAVGNHQGS